MRSRLPKVLHPLAGKPLIHHVLDAAAALGPRRVHVVHGAGGDRLRAALDPSPWPLHWVEQSERLGTGHAVRQVVPHLEGADTVLVLCGDVPLIRCETLERLLERTRATGLALVTVRAADPAGYGRILRDAAGRIRGIVEERDASPEERAIDEVNTGILAARADLLARYVGRLENDNAQGEYYLTDVIAMAVADGIEPASTAPVDGEDETRGVNDRAQLARLERVYQRRQAARLLAGGVTLLDPARFDVRGEVVAGADVVIDVNVVLEGHVELGDGVHIGPNCVLRDVRIGAGARIAAQSVLEDAEVGPGCRIGPFARLRPGARIAEDAHIGNFVEVKQSSVGRGTKINHLSYVGDAVIGSGVNIGAGTITCNYDGAAKHVTRIGDRAFIGSDTQLVAPVTVGEDAVIGAGSTITRDAPPGELTLSRVPQETRKGWKRPAVKRKDGG